MEYYNYPPPPPLPEKKDRTLWRVLMVGCVFLLLIGAVAGFLFSRFLNVANRPKKVIEDQVDAINEGNFKLAYEYFGKAYQKTVPISEFRKSLKSFSSQLPIRELNLSSVTIRNDRALVDGTFSGSTGVIFPVHYELIHEKEDWRILDYEWTPPGDLLTI
jgi:hypothetical protein